MHYNSRERHCVNALTISIRSRGLFERLNLDNKQPSLRARGSARTKTNKVQLTSAQGSSESVVIAMCERLCARRRNALSLIALARWETQAPVSLSAPLREVISPRPEDLSLVMQSEEPDRRRGPSHRITQWREMSSGNRVRLTCHLERRPTDGWRKPGWHRWSAVQPRGWTLEWMSSPLKENRTCCKMCSNLGFFRGCPCSWLVSMKSVVAFAGHKNGGLKWLSYKRMFKAAMLVG